MGSQVPDAPSWQEAVFRVLKKGDVAQIAYVPDAGHAHVIREAQRDPDICDVVLTTEEEGVALVCGAWLGGQRAVLLMQSSGVGNCVNMFSLLSAGQFPFLTLVTMRGEYAEFNPWQGPMGRATQRAMELMGITVLRVEEPDRVEDTVAAALDAAFVANERVAVLLGQRLIGRKKWQARVSAPVADDERRLDRRRFTAALLSGIPDALVVTGLGSPTYDVFAAGARPENFHLWGAMGGAVPLGLGLALAQPGRSVVVVTGDGELLMGIGALATVGALQPPNLTVVVLDNGRYGETGGQRSHTSLGTDLVAVARGLGIRDGLRVVDEDGAEEVARRVRARAGTTVADVLVAAEEAPRVLPPRDGVAAKNAFRAALGFPGF